MSFIKTSTPAENPEECTGCAACAAVCPSESIAMQADQEGFPYPRINPETCNNCELCYTACPVNKINSGQRPEEGPQRMPLSVFASWHLDEVIRHNSSSGGVFTALADSILADRGIVTGAAFDENMVVRHIQIEKPDELHRLRGSKYVQSEITPALYESTKNVLVQNRPVLFSGTPCQVAGLRSFLGRHYENLFCCDIICHGVPSPAFFERYLQNIAHQGKQLSHIFFRDKTLGWKKMCTRWELKNGRHMLFNPFADPYMAAFLYDFALRRSCYVCKFTNVERTGDLTIADFWGVGNKYPEYDREDKGTSLVLVNTDKGLSRLDHCRKFLFLGPADIKTAINGNPQLVRPNPFPPQRNDFYRDLRALRFEAVIRKYGLREPSLPRRIIGAVKKRGVKAADKLMKQMRRGGSA